ncbi:hypothetical protein ACU686_16110 [Yinghuangia aomiensis]
MAPAADRAAHRRQAVPRRHRPARPRPRQGRHLPHRPGRPRARTRRRMGRLLRLPQPHRRHLLLLRGFFSSVDDLAPGVAAIEGIRMRPLRGDAKPMRYAHVSDAPADALYPRDASYFDTLHAFVQTDRIDQVDPYMHGVLAALGIRKGQEFAPTPRQRELLDLAARTGWKTAKTLAAGFDREPDALWWSDRQWVAHAKTAQDDFWRHPPRRGVPRPRHRPHGRERQGAHVRQPLLDQHRHDELRRRVRR